EDPQEPAEHGEDDIRIGLPAKREWYPDTLSGLTPPGLPEGASLKKREMSAGGGFVYSSPPTDSNQARSKTQGEPSWLANTRSKERETSESWPTSTRARRRRPSAFFTT